MPISSPQSAPFARRILELLPASAGRFPDFESLARELGLHPRTLRRHLRDEGTSYLCLRHRARTDLAAALLVDGGLSHEQIAQHLGMSDGSSFRRAFRRWTGLSPSEYRAP